MSINTIGVNSSLGLAVAQADGTRNGFYAQIPVGTSITMLRIYLTPGFTGSIDDFSQQSDMLWLNATPFTSGTSLVITQNGGAPLTTLYFQPDNGGGGPVCFLGHAPVATPTGSKRIDSLAEGDLVLTESGKAVPIQRVKVMRCRPGPTTNPYVIVKGQFGATEELLISPRHKVAVGTDMVEAKDLGLQQKAMKAPFNYYNLELPNWSNMCVAGVEVESLAPAKRITATVDQVKAAIAALPASQKNAETMKTLNRICQKTADGKIVIFGSTK